jgi:hypothetical protein
VIIPARTVAGTAIRAKLVFVRIDLDMMVRFNLWEFVSLTEKPGRVFEPPVKSLQVDFEDLGTDLGEEVPDEDGDEDEEKVEELAGNEARRVVQYVHLGGYSCSGNIG